MPEDFQYVVMREMQITNSYKERAEVELSVKTSPQSQSESSEFADQCMPSFHVVQPPTASYPHFDPIKQPDFADHFPNCKDFNPNFYQFV